MRLCARDAMPGIGRPGRAQDVCAKAVHHWLCPGMSLATGSPMVQDGGVQVLSWAQSDIWSACSWQTARSYLSVAYSGIPSRADCASTWAQGKGWECRVFLIGNRKGRKQEKRSSNNRQDKTGTRHDKMRDSGLTEAFGGVSTSATLFSSCASSMDDACSGREEVRREGLSMQMQCDRR